MENDLSVFLIVKNEAENLPSSLEKLKGFAKEIIVVDGFSTDGTLDIAKSFGAKTFQREMESFTAQKQYALDQCTCKWVLNIDADEHLTEDLKAEISAAIKDTDVSLFYISLVNVFLGRRMKHSGLSGQKKERLALRAKAKYVGGLVHETMIAEGKTAFLKNSFDHYPYRTISHYFEKFNKYTSLGAYSLREKNKKFKMYNLLRQPFDFTKIYIFKLGFLDGIQGFLWAFFSSLYPVVKYAKLWNIYQREKENNK